MSLPNDNHAKRLAGIALYGIAIALIVWQVARYSARFDEVDNGLWYTEPLDYVLGAVTIACVVVAFVTHRRLG